MRSLVFEGNTRAIYEELRDKDNDQSIYIFAIGGHYDQH